MKRLFSAASYLVLLFIFFTYTPIISSAEISSDYFQSSYENILSIHEGDRKEAMIQQFNGVGLITEYFDPARPNWYAGHLGGFFIPPFYSQANFIPEKGYFNPDTAFFTGLVIKNGRYFVTEDKQDRSKTATTWTPSMLSVTNFYPGAGGGTYITGNKSVLKDAKGINLNLIIKNTSPSAQEYSILLITNIPTLDRIVYANDDMWSWAHNRGSLSKDLKSEFSPETGGVLFYNESKNIYIIAGMTDVSFTWQISDFSEWLNSYKSFINLANNGNLPNTGIDDKTDSGSSSGIAFNTGSLGTNESKSVNYTIVMSDTKQGAIKDFLKYKGKGAPEIIDSITKSVDSSLKKMFDKNLPSLEVTNLDKKGLDEATDFEKIYYNSALQYYLNRWDSLGGVSEQNFRANSLAFFPWTIGTEYFFTQVDRAFWRGFLLKVARTDLNKCNATSLLSLYDKSKNWDRCMTDYAGSRFGIIKLFYNYVMITSDNSILSEKVGQKNVLETLKGYMDEYNNNPDKYNSGLTDFGNDLQLYEFSISGCNLGGRYTGYVPDMNAEKYYSNYMLSNLYRKLGNTSMQAKYLSEAKKSKLSLMKLWDSQDGWFSTKNTHIAVTDPKQDSYTEFAYSSFDSIPKTNFYFLPIYNTLGYPGLLSSQQRTALLSRMDSFVGPYGLYSLPKSLQNSKCTREDWHGPGIYGGEAGLALDYLLEQGDDHGAKAYGILKKYYYLADLPIWPQQFDANNKIVDASRSWYLEGVSFAQMYIKGFMGLNYDVANNSVVISPNIPASITDKNTVKFEDAFMQGHLWSLEADKNKPYKIDVKVSYLSDASSNRHFRFNYQGDRETSVTLSNMSTGSFNIRADNVKLNTTVKSEEGQLKFKLPANSGMVFVKCDNCQDLDINATESRSLNYLLVTYLLVFFVVGLSFGLLFLFRKSILKKLKSLNFKFKR